MRPAIVGICGGRSRRIPVTARRKRRHGADSSKHKNAQRSRQDRNDRHLDFLLLNLLAHIFGRAPDHQTANKDGNHSVNQHAIETGAHASKDNFVGLDVKQGNEPADRGEAVMHANDGPATGVRRYGRK